MKKRYIKITLPLLYNMEYLQNSCKYTTTEFMCEYGAATVEIERLP